MQGSFTIDKTKYSEIIWPIVALYFIRIHGFLSDELMFIIYIGFILVIIGFNKVILTTKFYGMYPYIIWIVVMSIVGIATYESREVARDFFYFAPTVVLVILGFYLFYTYEKKSIVKTFVLCGLINALHCILMFGLSLGEIKVMQDIRDIFNCEIYEMCMITLVLAIYIFDNERVVFGKVMDVVLFILFIGIILMSFSRSVWVDMVVGIALVIILNLIFRARKAKTYLKTSIIIIVAALSVIFIYTAAPSHIINDYNAKIEKTSDEINERQSFKTIEDASNSWRGYEAYCATKQWKKSPSINQLFGSGLGKPIYVKFVPYAWAEKGMVKGHDIPLLHNAYYTMLVKGGIVGIIFMLLFCLYPLYIGIKSIKRNGFNDEALILITLPIALLVQAYVVRGLIVQHPNIVWGVLIGWFCGYVKKEED